MNIFEIEINRSLKALTKANNEFFSWRLFDTNSFRGQVPYAPQQPGDWMAICRGYPTLLEAKSSVKEPSFNTQNIQPHQWKALKDFGLAGGWSYFLLNRRSTPKHYQCFAIEPEALEQIITSTEKKSVRWKLLEENSINVPRIDITVDEKGTTAKGWQLKVLPSFSSPWR